MFQGARRFAPLLILALSTACGDSDGTDDAGVPVDTGNPDSGTRDSGPTDTGTRDVGVDAAVDAGPTDSGFIDTGLSDSGPNDTGVVIDAGDVDAGDMDAGLVDSGPMLPPCGVAMDATGQIQLRITADDARTVYINGVLELPRTVGWNIPTTASLPIYLHPLRQNTVAVYVENLQKIDGFDRGLLAELTHTTSAAVSSEVLTSSTTRVATSSVAGWTEATFDDSAWDLATVEGPHGMGPWGAVFGTSNAQWVWTYDSSIPASQKPDVEPMFARINFFVHRDGRLYAAPDDCAP